MFDLSTGLAILAFFIVIGPLILFHELGHFWAARAFDVRVEEFGIGYPPRAVSLFERKGTVFSLNWIPLGGFVRLTGEDDPEVEGGFADASKTARLVVLAGGAAMNMVVAFLLFIAMYMLGAPVEQPGARVVVVAEDSPAEAAGLQEGDIIRETDGIPVETSTDLTTYIFGNAGSPITLTVERGGELIMMDMVPRVDPPEGQGPTGIQIEGVFDVQRFGLFGAIGQAAEEVWFIIRAFVTLPAQIIANEIPARFLRPVSVVGISQLGGQALEGSIEQNALWPIVRLTAYISVALAVTNLLPIPALDGGRILFVLIEVVRGKRIKPEHEMTVHFLGFAALLALMVVFIILDIVDPLVVP